MVYIKYTFNVEKEISEMLLAFLSDLPFEAFQENSTGFDAYIQQELNNSELESHLKALGERFSFDYETEILPSKNWNKEWESSFRPIQVDDFCAIRASFHDSITDVEHEIVIDPQMAFGTGHHATTYMMIKLMAELEFGNKRVLDFGTGTGVLAILSSILGASEIDANDIELPAYENSILNSDINSVSNINVYHGGLDQVPTDHKFDIILANINRNVLLDHLLILAERMNPNSHLMISGFYFEDVSKMKDAASNAGLAITKSISKDRWMCLMLCN